MRPPMPQSADRSSADTPGPSEGRRLDLFIGSSLNLGPFIGAPTLV